MDSPLVSKTPALPVTPNAPDSASAMTDDLRAMRALRLLLESRMIDRTEYERRLASFKRRLELVDENNLENNPSKE